MQIRRFEQTILGGRYIAVAVLLTLTVTARPARSQSACASAVETMIMLRAPATGAVVQQPLTEIRRMANTLLRKPAADDRGHQACVVAELLKRRGDPQADVFYRKAISADPSDAEYRLLYGDYLRNYRGPGQPLVAQAAAQYYEGLRTADTFVRNQIRRSLIALYERDGLSLIAPIDQKRPGLFFSTQNVGSRSPADPGIVDEVRALTSAALFAESTDRLNRPLVSSELNAFVRNGWRGQTLERLRTRYRTLAIDAFFDGRRSMGSQVVNFFQPQSAADVATGLAGVGVEHVMDLYPLFDLMVRGDLKVGSRTGLIEFLPNADESVRSTIGRAVISRFVGPDKLNIEFSASRDHITQHVSTPINRDANVVGGTVRYQIFRPLLGSAPYERPIASRGSEIFVGSTRGSEAFGTIDVVREDFFAGVSLKGLPGGGNHTFDVTVQPTVFRFRRDGHRPVGIQPDSLNNEQVETFVTVLYRLVDRENERNADVLPPLVFLNLVGVASFNVARSGPSYFERTRIGGQIDAKLVGRYRGGTTWLASGRYEWQNLTNLGHRQHVMSASVSLGF